jgi:hypothetical protein
VLTNGDMMRLRLIRTSRLALQSGVGMRKA